MIIVLLSLLVFSYLAWGIGGLIGGIVGIIIAWLSEQF